MSVKFSCKGDPSFITGICVQKETNGVVVFSVNTMQKSPESAWWYHDEPGVFSTLIRSAGKECEVLAYNLPFGGNSYVVHDRTGRYSVDVVLYSMKWADSSKFRHVALTDCSRLQRGYAACKWASIQEMFATKQEARQFIKKNKRAGERWTISGDELMLDKGGNPIEVNEDAR